MMKALLTFAALAIPAVILLLIMWRQISKLWNASASWRIGAVIVATFCAVVGFLIPVAVLGPSGIPAGVAAGVLGAEFAFALGLYHLKVQRWYAHSAGEVMTRNPELKQTTVGQFVKRLLNKR